MRVASGDADRVGGPERPLGRHHTVALRFTSISGASQIDDIFIDPLGA